MNRECRRCRKELNIEQFGVDNSCSDKISTICKECRKKEWNVFYSAKKEEYCKKRREYWNKNKELINLKRNERRKTDLVWREKASIKAKERYLKNKEKLRVQSRERLYGLKNEEFLKLLIKQNRSCAVCKKEFDNSGRDVPCVDHNHKNGEIRGLLCHQCNRTLGLLKDDAVIVSGLLAYLSRYWRAGESI